MDFADYPGLNGDLAADFHARHFMRRDTHVYDSNNVSHLPPYNAAALAGLAVDVKPRLTKEQHDVLENEFQKQSKPNTNTKKRFAEVLGVSLDKVNNWFQNRRAKSKQDAKKQAGAFNLLQATHQQPSFSSMNPDNISPTYCPPDAFNNLRDSAILDGPMSGGLGISQADNRANLMGQDFGGMGSLNGIVMQHSRSQQHHSISHETAEDEHNRRTLTQAQFDVFGDAKPFMSSPGDQGNSNSSSNNMSATITNPSEIYGQYDFPDLYDFKFDDSPDPMDPFTSTPMRPSQSTDSYLSNAGNHSDSIAPSMQGPTRTAASARSTSSTPSVSITPANLDSEPSFEYGLQQNQSTQSMPIQSTTSASGQWQPGQSIPVDLAALQQEFEQAAMRNRTQSVPAVPCIPARFLDQPLSYPGDDFPRRDSSTVQLARSMQNFTMTGQRSAMPSSTIAARRQRPKPAPLGGASLRSTSFAGQLPMSPGPVTGPAGQSLRRIKSSNTVGGIANGRIQKNVGSAQRSPSGVAFADVAQANRFARRVSSFSPAALAGIQASSAGLAPPTPMSPTSFANLHLPSQNMRSASISEPEGDGSSNSFSPPTSPLYAAQFARGRLGSTADNTPPQSAPATQQCFPNNVFPQGAPHIQGPMSSVPVLQSQAHGFVPIMSNEYPQMPNVVYPQQQQQQQQQMPGQYMDMPPMSYIMTNTGEVHMGYALVPPFAQQQMQHATPPHAQHPFVPSSNSSPGHMVSSQVPKHSNPSADFFVHEYTPPQDVKQSVTPRKAAESGPKNYTFSNHGPEYFERHVKKQQEGSSPTSSAEGSTSA